MSMRCGDLGRWAPHVVCTDGMDYSMIGYARHHATWSFGDALLVSSWLITACCAGWTGLGHCSLGSCCFGDYFRCFHFHSHSLDLFMHGGSEFIWINGMYNRVIYPTESLHCKLLSCIFTTWFSFQLDLSSLLFSPLVLLMLTAPA